MNLEHLDRVAFGAMIIGFFLTAIFYPVIKTYLVTGRWPVVFHRNADRFQSTMKTVFGLYIGGMLLWTLLYVVYGPERLGIYEVPAWAAFLGWVLMIAGLVFTVLSQSHLGKSWRIGIDDRKTELVTGGLYRFSRNPIFTGMFVFLIGIVLVTPSGFTIMGFVGMWSLICLQVYLEEQALLSHHGNDYLEYSSRVGRFLPMVGRMKGPAEVME